MWIACAPFEVAGSGGTRHRISHPITLPSIAQSDHPARSCPPCLGAWLPNLASPPLRWTISGRVS